MRGALLFLSGAVVGALVVTSVAAQSTLNTGLRLNHVGISVPNFQETVDFYETVMGFRVSHRFAPNPDGRPGTAFVQISRDTFIEIAPAAADAKPTITHLGIGADDIKATVARLAQNGGKPTEPRPSANSGSILANITDPAGIRTELNEQPPGSMMRKAIESWK
ncbi:MAG: VOC family protein [Acidobacteria bacterium]|nr:VOC family protein [Acidobacteriota bacterium]